MLRETWFVARYVSTMLFTRLQAPACVERRHPGLDSGSTADPIVPSDQAWKLIPGEVSADGADDRKRRDVGNGKAGATHEFAIDQ
jgi:hypothetical protein